MLSLQQISDRLELQQLVFDYANAIDAREFDRLDQVFTEDAYVDYRVFGGICGCYPEVKPWLREVLTSAPPYQHLVGNTDHRIDGDRATGRVLCLNPTGVALPQGGAQIGFYGLWYVDTYVRTAVGWRISSRTEEKCFAHNFPGA